VKITGRGTWRRADDHDHEILRERRERTIQQRLAINELGQLVGRKALGCAPSQDHSGNARPRRLPTRQNQFRSC
jgi:hypothetical protein